MTAFYGKERWETSYLEVNTGYTYLPALGITFDMVAMSVSKNGADFETKEVDEYDWRDLGEGYYAVRWTEGDLNVLGPYLWRLAVPALSIEIRGKFDVDPAPMSVEASAPTCVVAGNIVDIGGDPLILNTIRFRPRNVPSAAGQSIVASGHIQTTTDAYGNFSVKLLRSASVLVEIENAGIRHLIVVPDQPTASLIDLLPPIPLPIP